jgi:hypothetical protein
MKRLSLILVLAVALLVAAPALAAKKPKPPVCGVYYKYNC